MKTLLTVTALALCSGTLMAQQQAKIQEHPAGLYTNIHTPPVRNETITIRKTTDANSEVNPNAKPALQIKKEASHSKNSGGASNSKQ